MYIPLRNFAFHNPMNRISQLILGVILLLVGYSAVAFLGASALHPLFETLSFVEVYQLVWLTGLTALLFLGAVQNL